METMTCIYCGETINGDDEVGFYESIKPLKPVCYNCSESGELSQLDDSFDPNCDYDLGVY